MGGHGRHPDAGQLHVPGGHGGHVGRRPRPGRARRVALHRGPPGRLGRLAARLEDMDTDGIDQSVLYPTLLLGLQSFTGRRVRGRAVPAPTTTGSRTTSSRAGGRLFGAAVLPQQDIEAGGRPRSAGWPSLPGIVAVFMRPNPQSSGDRSATPSTTRLGGPPRTPACRSGCTPSWPPTSPGRAWACASTVLRQLGEPARRRRHRGRCRSTTSTSPRPSPTPST